MPLSNAAVHCLRGIDCKSDKPGHAMTFMRQRMAHLEEERWLDAVVVDFESDWALVEVVLTGERYLLWNHEDLRTWLWGNDLVSFSEKYSTLGVRDNRLNVIVMKQSASLDDALASLLA